MNDVTEAVVFAFRTQWPSVVTAVKRFTGDWDVAEECAQDAFAKALERWPADGIPDRPGAWLTATARNRAIDHRRREVRGIDKLIELARQSHPPSSVDTPEESDDGEANVIPDERLRLMFACCHPALSPEVHVALTLRTLTGLSTNAIARAFHVSEVTMSKRLLRAKAKIRHATFPVRARPQDMLGERTEAALGMLQLMFDKGCSVTGSADLVHRELRLEAIRLARLWVELMPREAAARALLLTGALLESHHDKS